MYFAGDSCCITPETMIPADDSVGLLSQFAEAMDLTDLYFAYERINSLSPRTLLKIVLYSYMNGDYSSRSMELNCRRDINFMYLLEGAQVPDHATFGQIPQHSFCFLRKTDSCGNVQCSSIP